MQLTDRELEAVRSGEPVRLTEGGTDLVVMRADLFERLRELVYDDSPWTDERMEKVLDKLYDGCEEHAEAHSELYKEMQALRSQVVGRPSPKLKITGRVVRARP